mmetsp:Transcript_56065/g.103760  ORF Transcript_56065/g.103760 Transcript_56065/m.103760 type:complete len:218 (+) Transcript_56065:733-1386(+)
MSSFFISSKRSVADPRIPLTSTMQWPALICFSECSSFHCAIRPGVLTFSMRRCVPLLQSMSMPWVPPSRLSNVAANSTLPPLRPLPRRLGFLGDAGGDSVAESPAQTLSRLGLFRGLDVLLGVRVLNPVGLAWRMLALLSRARNWPKLAMSSSLSRVSTSLSVRQQLGGQDADRGPADSCWTLSSRISRKVFLVLTTNFTPFSIIKLMVSFSVVDLR